MTVRRSVLLVAAGLSLLAGPALPAAAEVVVTPDVPSLPVGGAPALPYVDVPGERIVDGSRRVGIAGLQGTVTRLYKMDGGYVLGRTVGSSRNDLVFVTRSGVRHLITRYWDAPNPFTLEHGVIVAEGGDRMVFNRKRVDTTDPQDYLDTIVLSLPERRILHRRTFSWPPTLMADATSRVLISLPFGRTLWWTPGVFPVETVSTDAVGQAADLSADQYAAYTSDGRVVRAIAPGAPTAFVLEADDVLGFWSPDDDMIAGTGEVMDDRWATAHLVWQASNGTPVLTILREGPPRITWESNTSVLVLAVATVGTGYQWIRCSLTGTCQRVGPPSSSPYGSLVPATRRNA